MGAFMNKRDLMFELLEKQPLEAPVPAAFFLHFDPLCHRGMAAVKKHLEYFRYTGMDMVKIQYEHVFPSVPGIAGPDDWINMPRYGEDFFAEPFEVVEGLVKEAKDEAPVIMTLYSALMCAGHAVGSETVVGHFEQDPAAVTKGMEIVTESLLTFVRGCIDRGVDGFYASSQGGESSRFNNRSIFENYIKPCDLIIMEEINRRCDFNILHICDYHGTYDDLEAFLDYPGDVVSCGLELSNGSLTAKQVAQMFDRPYFGGMDRHGIITSGPPEEIRKKAQIVLQNAPERFILGADCTVPPDTSWDNLKAAIEAAHRFR